MDEKPPQTVDIKTSSYDDAWRYAQTLENKGYSIKLTTDLIGSNWFWHIEGSKP